MNITAFSILIEIDGQVSVVPILSDRIAELVDTLAAEFQGGDPAQLDVVNLPPEVVLHVSALSDAFNQYFSPKDTQ